MLVSIHLQRSAVQRLRFKHWVSDCEQNGDFELKRRWMTGCCQSSSLVFMFVFFRWITGIVPWHPGPLYICAFSNNFRISGSRKFKMAATQIQLFPVCMSAIFDSQLQFTLDFAWLWNHRNHAFGISLLSVLQAALGIRISVCNIRMHFSVDHMKQFAKIWLVIWGYSSF